MLEKVTVVLTNMCSGSLSVASFVLGNFCLDACVVLVGYSGRGGWALDTYILQIIRYVVSAYLPLYLYYPPTHMSAMKPKCLYQ